MVSVAILVIGATALLDRDVAGVSAAITTILIALGLAELREIKTSTNGNTTALMEQNKALMAELAQYRRDSATFTNRALESQPLLPANPASGQTTTTHMTASTAPTVPAWDSDARQ
jgi:hypothetical protein